MTHPKIVVVALFLLAVPAFAEKIARGPLRVKAPADSETIPLDVAVYTSSIDNGTNDSILRTE